MSLWSSLQRVIAPEDSGNHDSVSATGGDHRDDDDGASASVEQLRAAVLLERRNAERLSQSLDAERAQHQTEVRQLRELLRDKEEEIALLEAQPPASSEPVQSANAVVELQRRLAELQRDQVRSSSLHDSFVGSLAKLLHAPAADERALLAALERLVAERGASDRSAELKQRNDVLTRQLKDSMLKVRAAADTQAQLDASRAAESEVKELLAQSRARVAELEADAAARANDAASGDAERARELSADLELRCVAAERTLERVRDELDAMRREHDEAVRDADESRAREKQAESEAMVLRQELHHSAREADRLRQHLLQQEEAAELTEARAAELEARVADLRGVGDVVAARERQIDELRHALRDKDNELTLVSKAVVDLQAALESFQTETTMQLQAEMGELATRLALANGRVAALEVLEQRYATLQGEWESLHARFAAQADELARARTEALQAVGDATTLRYAVEKLVAQVDLLSQNEVRTVARERVKQLVLDIVAGGVSARRTALEAVASICSLSVAERKRVGLIASSWLEAAGLVSPSLTGDAAPANGGLASTFVQFLEESVLADQVNEIQLQEQRETQKGAAAEL
jgi:hypothetical protein